MSDQNSVYRILDAAIHRAGEGLRVVEDHLRMARGDAYLSSMAKRLRHELTQAAGSLPQTELVMARDSQRDVGRHLTTESEFQRGSEHDLVMANLSRTQQALRTIEEYGKTVSSELAYAVEQIRYDVYTLEKAIVTSMLSQQRLEQANLCVLIDGCGSIDRLTRMVEELIDAGVDLLQFRDKRLTDRDQMVAGLRLTELTRGTHTQWIMNDRSDLALAAGAHGVHLGQDDLHVADARQIVGANRLVGVSTHAIEQARQAVLDGANYIGVGPTYPSRTKTFKDFPGLQLLRSVAQEIQLPAFAIGGITPQNLGPVLETGIRRIAVRHCVVSAPRPGEVARELKRQLTSEAPTQRRITRS